MPGEFESLSEDESKESLLDSVCWITHTGNGVLPFDSVPGLNILQRDRVSACSEAK